MDPDYSPLGSTHLTTAFNIDLASCTLSTITDLNRGDGLPMSSRASRTAAMIDGSVASAFGRLQLVVGRQTSEVDESYSSFFSFRAFTLNQIGVPLKPKASRI